MEGYAIFFAGLLFFILFLLLIFLVFHIFMAIGLYTIAKREGRGDIAWLGWIPIANYFLLTTLVENDVHESMQGKFTLIYGIAVVGSFVLSWFIPFVGIIPAAILLYGFYFLASWYSRNEAVHVVVAAVTATVSLPFQLFMLRNRERLER